MINLYEIGEGGGPNVDYNVEITPGMTVSQFCEEIRKRTNEWGYVRFRSIFGDELITYWFGDYDITDDNLFDKHSDSVIKRVRATGCYDMMNYYINV